MPPNPPQPTQMFLQALQGVLTQVADPNQVLRTILDQAVAQTGADRGLFVEVSSDGGLQYQVLHQYQGNELSGQTGRFSRNLFARVLEEDEGVLLERALDDPQFRNAPSVQVLLNSILCMPIRAGGRIVALVHLENRRPGHFKEEHREALGALLVTLQQVLA